MDSESLQLPDEDAFVHTDSDSAGDLDLIDQSVPLGRPQSAHFSQSSADSPDSLVDSPELPGSAPAAPQLCDISTTTISEDILVASQNSDLTTGGPTTNLKRRRFNSSPPDTSPNERMKKNQKIDILDYSATVDSTLSPTKLPPPASPDCQPNPELKRSRSEPEDGESPNDRSKKLHKNNSVFSPFQPRKESGILFRPITTADVEQINTARANKPPSITQPIPPNSHLVCPIPSCKFKNLNPLKVDAHINTHIKDKHDISDEWLKSNSRAQCWGCGLLVSTKSDSANMITELKIYAHKACKASAVSKYKASQLKWVPKDTEKSTPQPPTMVTNNSTQRKITSNNIQHHNVPKPIYGPKIQNIQNPTMPSLQEIFTTNIPTRTHIPFSCIKLFGNAFHFAINQVITNNDQPSWAQFFAFGKCIMWTQPKKEKQHVRSDLVIKLRIESYLAGNWVTLWNEASKLKPISNGPTNRNWEKLVVSKVESGNVSSAFRSLDSFGVHPSNPITFKKLSNLHPSVNEFKYKSIPSDLHNNQPLSFPPQMIEKAIKSFPNGSSAGPDGFRVEWLKDLLRKKNINMDFRVSLDKLFGLLTSGKGPSFVAPFFTSARLIPLKKKDDGVRPIAIGGVLRRLLSKLILLQIYDKTKFLRPYQHGVGVSHGAEIIIHKVRNIIKQQTSEDFVAGSIDFENAFNSVSRPKFIDGVRKHLPELLPIVSWQYGNEPLLFVSNTQVDAPQHFDIINSSNGSQQGDPLGPLLFALVLNEFIQKNLTKIPVVSNDWFFDDGLVCGSTESVHRVFDVIANEGPKYGLIMNQSKSSVYWPSGSTFNSDIFHPSIQKLTDGFQCLGVPLGNNDYIEKVWNDKFNKMEHLFSKIGKIKDPQISFTLLSTSLNFSKLVYYLRTSHPESTAQLATSFEKTKVKTFETIIGDNLSKHAILQSQLPMKLGGLGLRSAFTHSASCFISSVNACQTSIPTPFKDSLIQERNTAGPLLIRNLDPFKESPDKLVLSTSQKVISESIDQYLHKHLLESCNSDFDRSRLFSCIGTFNSLILNAPLHPIRGSRLSPHEFHYFIASRLGLDLCPEGVICPQCKQHTMDSKGYHVAVCTFTGSVIHRHNLLRDIIFEYCQQASWNPRKEISLDKSPSLIPDIIIPTKGLPTALDVTVVHPHSTSTLRASSKTSDAANNEAERNKNIKYLDACKAENMEFVPLSVEYFGRWGNSAQEWFFKLAKGIANRSNRKPKSILKDLYRKLSFSLLRSNAKAVFSRINN